jgi:hypothetical protein
MAEIAARRRRESELINRFATIPCAARGNPSPDDGPRRLLLSGTLVAQLSDPYERMRSGDPRSLFWSRSGRQSCGCSTRSQC